MLINDYVRLIQSEEGRKIITNIDEKRLEKILTQREREGFYSTETMSIDPKMIEEVIAEILAKKKIY